ncbi:hypothetical protein [Bradyrhizobium sp. SZCCHNR3015]|uniref:hypothetical protein n=1 Tax=Bradyrhizobium sp. SZCCHNR3015 TaxID=3057395 RepID=UPI002916A8CA|nr:hypothetical protein [Bradyrhizobium sp. SZCCHNR3015]
MPFFLRVGRDGQATVCETQSSKLHVPDYLGKIWLDGEAICLQFPSIENIKVAGRAPMQIISHMLRFSADEKGMLAVDAVLRLRQQMLQKGNEKILIALAERGTDNSAILQTYREILS